MLFLRSKQAAKNLDNGSKHILRFYDSCKATEEQIYNHGGADKQMLTRSTKRELLSIFVGKIQILCCELVLKVSSAGVRRFSFSFQDSNHRRTCLQKLAMNAGWNPFSAACC